MIESQQVLEWINMGRAEGAVKNGIDSLLDVLATRFPPGAPADLEAAIRATTNRDQLRGWLVSAVKVDSLDAFRQAAGM
ncbi:MAG TPA: hypothetical protein VH682_21275 [Gemmataceae bacterium]